MFDLTERELKEENWKESIMQKKKATKTKQKNQKTNNIRNRSNTTYLYGVLIFLLGTLTSFLIVQYLSLPNTSTTTAPAINNETEEIKPENKNPLPTTTTAPKPVETTSATTEAQRPTFAMYAARTNQENLSVIRKILKLLGYTEVSVDEDWNLLWGFESPFPDFKGLLTTLKPHQMVNHMPGMSYIVHKVQLSTSGSPYMPPAFKLPKEKDKFLEYAKNNPNKLFVEKNNGHRNVAIKKPEDIDLESNSTFVQEFLTNPYLVDGYKFDIGIYTVITSIEPLRLYIYTGDVMFRYCREKFHPFDPNVMEKYVVGDAYRPTWEVPSLVKYFNRYGGGMRASFDAYVRDQGQDPSRIWQQAEEVIRETLLSQAHNIYERWQKYPIQNFFELIRVDMILDTNFKMHLIEANLSPNMWSRRFKPNLITFEQVLYNALRLVGVGTPIKEQETLTNFGQRITAVTADKNIASNLNECVEHSCDLSCDDFECTLCKTCLSGEDYSSLAKAQREHIHRGDMKRIFPKPIYDIKKYDLAKETKNLTMRNKWLTNWFYHKCLYDRTWCQ